MAATPGVPVTEPPSGPPAPVEASTPQAAPPGVPAAPASPPAEGDVAPPPLPGAPSTEDDDRNRPSYAPPKMTGGDPLAG